MKYKKKGRKEMDTPKGEFLTHTQGTQAYSHFGHIARILQKVLANSFSPTFSRHLLSLFTTINQFCVPALSTALNLGEVVNLEPQINQGEMSLVIAPQVNDLHGRFML